MKKITVLIIVIIALSMPFIGFVHASEIESFPVIQPTTAPLKINVFQQSDNGVEIRNITETLNFWNER